MNGWPSGSCDSSRVDLTAAMSTSLLHSIYGSQVFQLPISDSNFDEETEDDQWTRVCFSTPQLNITRPRSAAPSTRYEHISQHSRTANFGSTSSVNLLQNNGKSLPRRPKTAAAMGRIVKQRDSSQSYSIRPRSAYPTHENRNNSKVPLKRPRTANMKLMSLQAQTVSAPVQNSTTPVALSSVPQYFDFWNEKPLKPRDWTKKTHPRTKWKRPQSSSGSLHYAKAGGKKRSGSNSEIENFNSEIENSNSSGKHNGADSYDQFSSGQTDDHTVDKIALNGKNLKSDSMLSTTKDSQNIDDESNHTQDDHQGTSLNSQQQNGSMLVDNHTGFNKNGDANDGDCLTRKNVRDVLGNDKGNGVDSDDYFKKKNLSDKALSWLDCGGGSWSSKTRFNLPVDLKTLEKMSPLEYLRAHCIISEQRKSHYSKVFSECCSHHYLSQRKEVIKALMNALYKLLPREDAESVCELVKLSSSVISVDKRMFQCICTVAERVYGRYLLPGGLYRDVIEIVDFEALQWKLRDCQLQQELYTLLLTLSS